MLQSVGSAVIDGQQDMDGQRVNLAVVPKAAAQADKRDIQQLLAKEQVPPEKRDWISSPHQREPLQMKEEEHEEDVTKNPFNVVHAESEVEAHSSQLHHSKEEPPTSTSTQHMKTETDRGDCGGPEIATYLDPSLNSEHHRLLSSGSDTDDSDDWTETSITPSGSNSVKNPKADKKTVDDKSLMCIGCGRVCSSKRGLNLHRNACSGGSFTCSVCGKCFTQRASLKTHMRIHTGEKPFECSFCGKCFNQREYMKTHMRIHTGEKPFECSFCGKCFNQRENLKTHMRIHTGEKPFRCSHCGVCFSWRETLKYHTRSHTGEKPYTCLECGKSFTASSHLKRHERSHT